MSIFKAFLLCCVIVAAVVSTILLGLRGASPRSFLDRQRSSLNISTPIQAQAKEPVAMEKFEIISQQELEAHDGSEKRTEITLLNKSSSQCLVVTLFEGKPGRPAQFVAPALCGNKAEELVNIWRQLKEVQP